VSRTIRILGPAHPLRGGLAAFDERLARAFQAGGHEVGLTTFSLQYPSILFPGKTQLADGPPPDGLDIEVRVNSIDPVSWLRVGRDLARRRPDLLIVRYWIPFMAPCLGTITRLVRRNRHTRVVAIVDNMVPHETRPGDTLLSRYFVGGVDGYVVMSDAVLRDLDRFDPDAPRRLSPHPLYDHYGDPVPRDEARAALGLDPDRPLVLFFGFIRAYKGLDLLLEAFADPRVRDTGAQLVIAGEFYEDPGRYETLITRLGLEDRIVRRTDYIPDGDVARYFGATDLVAQPYRSATQSGITQIATHFEVPMVVTDVGGLPEMVPHGRAGYVVPPEPAAIAGAIADYFAGDRSAGFRSALAVEKRRYRWEHLVDAFLEVEAETR